MKDYLGPTVLSMVLYGCMRDNSYRLTQPKENVRHRGQEGGIEKASSYSPPVLCIHNCEQIIILEITQDKSDRRREKW